MLEASPGATKKICLDLQRSRRFQKCLGKHLCMRHRTVATVAAQLRAPLCPARIDDPSTIRRQVSMDLHYDDVTTMYDVLRTTCYVRRVMSTTRVYRPTSRSFGFSGFWSPVNCFNKPMRRFNHFNCLRKTES